MVFDRVTVTNKVQQGQIAQAIIRPRPFEDCAWLLEFKLADGTQEPMTHARRETPKRYRSIDAALNDAACVGLKKAIVEMA